MTEAEVNESMTLFYGLTSDMFPIYLTSTTGYLVVAYLVGARLSRSQLIIISGLYVTFAIVASYLAVGFGLRGISYAEELMKISPSTKLYSTYVVPVAMAVALLGGILASLKFMWDIRHPENR